MKAWLRLVLVLFLVGGGFVDLASCATLFPQLSDKGTAGVFLFVVMLLCAAFQVISGLMVTQKPRSTGILRAAIALQIPWITSPLLSYRLMGGAGFWIMASSAPLSDAGQFIGSLYWRFQFGGFESMGIGESLPWSLGVNLIALTLFLLLPPVVKTKRPIRDATEDELTFWDSLPKPPAISSPK